MNETIGFAPSYMTNNRKLNTLSFKKAVFHTKNPEVDKQSIFEICQYGYALEERTIVKDLKRENIINSKELLNLVGNNIKKNNSKILIEYLCEEVEEYIGNNNKVGILLSGGLDSRILAGVLKIVQKRSTSSFKVIVYSWGMKSSRDIIYAEKIAKRYNWSFNPIIQNSDTLIENIKLASLIGCETNPVNLHSMNYIADHAEADVILAGSYGDSLGRAEYNGKKIEKAPKMSEKSKDKLHIFNKDFEDNARSRIKKFNDKFYYDLQSQTEKSYLVKELDYLRHHHTKYLSVAMSIISMKKPLYQLFTKKKTLSYLYSMDLSYRYEELYKDLLTLLPLGIGEIPWARTGKNFINPIQQEDDYLSNHHEYSKWFYERRHEIVNMIDLSLITSIGIFNEKTIYKMIEYSMKKEYSSLNKVIRTLIWLAAFSYMNRNCDLVIDSFKTKKHIRDNINTVSTSVKLKALDFIKN